MAGHPNWPKGSILHVGAVGHVAGAQIVNNLHFELSGAADTAIAAAGAFGSSARIASYQAEANAIIADIVTRLEPAYLAAHGNGYTLDKWTGDIIQQPGTAHNAPIQVESARGTTAPSGAGSGFDDTTTAVVVRLRTPFGGKRHRGRFYVGPIRAAWEGAGILTGDGITAFNALQTALLLYTGANTFTAAHGFLTVYSRPLHAHEEQWTVRVAHVLTIKDNPAAYAGDSTGVTNVLYDTTLRVVRRREVGVGA